jgi:hypothetical protein
MGVLINEFEIVTPSEGEAGQRPDEAAPQTATDESQQLEARDVHTLIQRREERRARIWAH